MTFRINNKGKQSMFELHQVPLLNKDTTYAMTAMKDHKVTPMFLLDLVTWLVTIM